MASPDDSATKATESEKRSIVRTLRISVPTGTTADAERVAAVLAAEGFSPVQLPLSVLRKLPEQMREAGGKLKPVLVRRGGGWKLVDLRGGRPLAAAVDVGTTNLAVSLVDPVSGHVVGEGLIVNPQVAFSEDVLDRILLSDKRLEDLRRPLMDSLNGLIGRLIAEAGGKTEDLVFLAIAGNTAMGHFVLGVDSTSLPVTPHNPVVHSPGFLSAADLGFIVHPEAEAYLVPNVGAFVGGDLVAGLFAAGFHEKKGVHMLVDVGTNAEVALTNGEWILVGAGAAGPALEGGVVSEGGRALKGSVELVRIRDGKMQVRTVGKAPARGICGSGLVDMLAVFFQLGWIDGRGELTDLVPEDRLTLIQDGQRGVVLVAGEETASGKPIVVTQRDMENLIRSKAAMYAILKTLTEQVDARFDQIERIYVAGAFGQYIKPQSAVAIGMLPPVPMDRFETLGNAALRGCEGVIRDELSLEKLDAMCARMTYIDMNANERFMKELPAAMFIPHTDEREFPG